MTVLLLGSDQSTGQKVRTSVSSSGSGLPSTDERILTPVTGVQVVTTSQLAIATLYDTPFFGNGLSLYNGSSWDLLAYGENSISLSSLSASTVYDLFSYNNSGAVAYEFVAWTNDTTRATAIVLQDGVWVKSGAPTRRWRGTIKTTSVAGQTEFSFGGTSAGGTAANLLIDNAQNRIWRVASVRESTDSWTYASAAWRNLNNSAGHRVNVVQGLKRDAIQAAYFGLLYGFNASGLCGYGVGIDSTTPGGAFGGIYPQNAGGTAFSAVARNDAHLDVGAHYIQAVEYGASGVTFWGDAGVTGNQSGLFVGVWL